jgi:hypothetical protein
MYSPNKASKFLIAENEDAGKSCPKLGTNSIHRLQTDKTCSELIRVYRSVFLMKIFCYVG